MLDALHYMTVPINPGLGPAPKYTGYMPRGYMAIQQVISDGYIFAISCCEN